MTATHSGEPWTTTQSQPDTFGKPSKQSDAPTKNHQSGHTDAETANHAKGKSTMASIYEIEKQVEAIVAQTRILCELMGIDPTPMPGEEPIVETPVDNETIQDLTDPDA
jgi:hypothetical protein